MALCPIGRSSIRPAGRTFTTPMRSPRNSMQFGIDRLLEDRALRKPLAGRRVALLAHPASVTRDLVHSLDALAALGDLELVAAFGPQQGLRVRAGWESGVGAGAQPMRHGLTLGEAAKWCVRSLGLDVDCSIIEMHGWEPASAPGHGWPLGERAWVNPSPNASNPWMARC